MLLTAHGHATVTDRLTAELADVESRFTAELLSDLSCVNSLVTHIERYRGKMLRPTLVLLSGLACSPPGRDLVDGHRIVATVVEMVHMATLVHDDILDEAHVRRRGATINQLSGNETAVMLGDYLISHAYHLCSSLGRPQISQIIAEATNIVCEGELLQLANRNNWALDERTYFEIIRRKTASLSGTCCRLGAMLSEASAPATSALYAYGEKLGVAFQIVDDLLDLVGDEATVGKTLGRDLQKGKLTLPAIHFLRTGPAERTQWLLEYLRGLAGPTPSEIDPAAASRIRDELGSSGSIEYARAQAVRLVSEARAGLRELPDSPPKALLADIADAVITRKY